MQLYVWESPYPVTYGGSCAYAVAETVEQARELVSRAWVSEYGYTPRPLGRKPDVSGEPTRVCDLPYAEIYEWSE